jgi:hypothetical protein
MFQLFIAIIKYIILHSPDCLIIKYYDKTDEIVPEEYRKDAHYMHQTIAVHLTHIFCPSYVSSMAARYKILSLKYIISLCQVRYLRLNLPTVKKVYSVSCRSRALNLCAKF